MVSWLSNKKVLVVAFLVISHAFSFILIQQLINPYVLLSDYTKYLDYETALEMANKSSNAGRVISKYVIDLIFLFVKISILSLTLSGGLFVFRNFTNYQKIFYSVISTYPVFLF